MPPAKPKNAFAAALIGLGIKLLVIGSVIACLLMLVLFATGFALIANALWSHRAGFFGATDAAAHAAGTSASNLALVEGLHGLEFLFFAPLPYLVFKSLARYFQSFLKSETLAVDADANEMLSSVRLHRVKALVLGLMTAAVATDLLSRAMQGVSLAAAAAEALVMVVLGSYWFILDQSCRHASLEPVATAEVVDPPDAAKMAITPGGPRP